MNSRPRRFRGQPSAEIAGRRVRVALSSSARLLGLAMLDRAAAGTGLLLPGCRSVHTFGMLFRLDLFFLDEEGRVVREVRGVGPGRVVSCRAAESVLEVPSPL